MEDPIRLPVDFLFPGWFTVEVRFLNMDHERAYVLDAPYCVVNDGGFGDDGR